MSRNIPVRRSPTAQPPLQLALDAAQMGTWHWDAASGELTWDCAMRAIFGIAPDAVIDGDIWTTALHPQDREDATDMRAQAMLHGGRFERRYRILRPDGEQRWVEAMGQVTLDEDGNPAGTIGCARDITEQVAVVEDLRRALQEQDRLLTLWQTAAQRTAALQAVTADLAGALTVQDVAQRVGTHMRRSVGAANGALSIMDDDPRYLRLAAWFGYGDEAVQPFRRHPLDSPTPLAHAVRTGEPVFVHADELATRFPELVAINHSATLVALPLVVAGQVFGSLALGFAQPQSLDAEQLAFFGLLAAQVAQAVDRSQLVERMRAVTHDLQAGFTPGQLPAVPGLDVAAGYSPGGSEVEEVGGDWFDVLALAGGRAALVIGDVMGRGVRASTAMTRYRAQLRAFVSIDPDPVSVVTRLDRLVAAQDPSEDDLVTLIYGVLDPATCELSYVNAGHPHPIRVAGTDCAPIGGDAGPPIGLTPGSVGLRDGVDPDQHPRERLGVRLRPGDLLLFHTDGLIERSWRDPDVGLSLLVQGLSRSLPDNGVTATALVGAVTALDLGPTAKDDVTMLAIRCTATV